mmetsp:Transcript_57546/g.148007  ORF Transcript_57546/g.148007 Transcript_57546/m.148007 type:complete len:256 (+) Transcript_57546:101-868(+)
MVTMNCSAPCSCEPFTAAATATAVATECASSSLALACQAASGPGEQRASRVEPGDRPTGRAEAGRVTMNSCERPSAPPLVPLALLGRTQNVGGSRANSGMPAAFSSSSSARVCASEGGPLGLRKIQQIIQAWKQCICRRRPWSLITNMRWLNASFTMFFVWCLSCSCAYVASFQLPMQRASLTMSTQVPERRAALRTRAMPPSRIASSLLSCLNADRSPMATSRHIASARAKVASCWKPMRRSVHILLLLLLEWR